MEKFFVLLLFSLTSFAEAQEISIPLAIDKKALAQLPTLEDVQWCFKSAGHSTKILAYDGLNHKLVTENESGDIHIFRKNNVVSVKTENNVSGSSAKEGVQCLPLGEQRSQDYFTQLATGLKQLRWARKDDAQKIEKCSFLINEFGGNPEGFAPNDGKRSRSRPPPIAR